MPTAKARNVTVATTAEVPENDTPAEPSREKSIRPAAESTELKAVSFRKALPDAISIAAVEESASTTASLVLS
ncbi:MAG: hypothetical protein K1X83_11665 [Oligoflexia bacterium]|nr:hypothetical protein [Oligoflexia bacterium]